MTKRITIQVTSRDRHSELGMLFQSLRTQTHKEWDLVLIDDQSGTPIEQNYFLVAMFNRLKLEGHKIKLFRIQVSQGVCYARNTAIEQDTFGNPYACRLDDDVILEPDYLEKLLKVITENGYDMATGVVPLLAMPEFIRETKRVGEIINLHRIVEGNLVENRDECGYCYNEPLVLKTHQFRTNCLMKREVQEKVRYPTFLSKIGFREEGHFSLSAQALGYKIGVHTGAVAYHLQCPSGGCRSNTYAQDVQSDDRLFRDWIKRRSEKGEVLLQ